MTCSMLATSLFDVCGLVFSFVSHRAGVVLLFLVARYPLAWAGYRLCSFFRWFGFYLLLSFSFFVWQLFDRF